MTQAPTVRLEQTGLVLQLTPGASNVEVLEGTVFGSFPATGQPLVELDDVRLSVSWHQDAKLAIWNADLTNQVGFHRLSIKIAGTIYIYDFRTRSAKATWEEVQSMAEVCAGAYFGFRRQFTYMAASGATRKVRLPQIHYAWLRDRLPEIERLVRSMDARPAKNIVRTNELSLHSKGLSVSQTSRLLRERHHFLERSETGPVQIDGAHYWPSRVVVSRKARESELKEHAQIVAFLKRLIGESQELAGIIKPNLRDEVLGYSELMKDLLSLSIFRNSAAGSRVVPKFGLPSTIQRTDRRYARMRELHSEYGADITDNMDYARSIRANVKEVWEIYQTFVAHVVGNSLGLEYASADKDLRKRAPQGWSMKSNDWYLYFDTKLPKDVLGSWREETSRPADERPDIVLIRSNSGRVILLDAKFKVEGTRSRATQRDLFEMQAYLNSYGTGTGAIIFPGSASAANLIAARGNGLLELPLRANQFEGSGGLEAIHGYVREALQLAADHENFEALST